MTTPKIDVDVVVVGAGFAGMAMVNRLHENGFSVQGFERGSDVGGTWYWNRYPGARCDVPSMEYSYRFSEDLQQEWKWSEHFAPQAEILTYAGAVAERFNLRRFFRFNTSIDRAVYDEEAGCWTVHAADGSHTSSRYLITAVGCLSAANTPKIPGLAQFAGETVHTGQWPHEGVDFKGKRVAVIGTGSSGVQSIPIIAKDAAQLTVYQRSAAYTIPAYNRAVDPAKEAAIKSDYRGFRAECGKHGGAFLGGQNERTAFSVSDEERERIYEAAWAVGGLQFMNTFADLGFDEAANDTAMDFFRRQIVAIVKDPDTAASLMPKYRFGVKRPCLDTGYFETYNRPNVKLVDLSKSPIERITEDGIMTTAGEAKFDILVLATGYDAITGPLLRFDIQGKGGRRLRDEWADGACNYLGLGVAGFPDMFIISGPGSPCVLTNMIYSIEQHVDWISDCLVHLRAAGVAHIEVDEQAQEAWGEEITNISTGAFIASGTSWYTGANIPGKPRRFMLHVDYPSYAARCDEVAAAGYKGFLLETA